MNVTAPRFLLLVAVASLFACAAPLRAAAVRTGSPPPDVVVEVPVPASTTSTNVRTPLKVTRVAHSSVLIDFGGGLIVLTDPWFTDKDGYEHGEPLSTDAAHLPKLSAIVVSHGHYDHFDLEGLSGYPDRAVPMITPFASDDMAARARTAGYTDVTELSPWQAKTVGELTVTALPGAHGMEENTYAVQAHGWTVFFGGDSLLIPEMKDIPAKFPSIDLALLPINGLHVRPAFDKQVVMNAEEAAQLAATLKPTVAVPIHYTFNSNKDSFLLRYDGTPERFTAAVQQVAPQTKTLVLETGTVLQLTDAGATATTTATTPATP